MSILDDVAGLVGAIGEPEFGAALMDLLHARCGADLCSVFTLGGGQPTVLIAESREPGSSPFARIASLRYAQRYWRRDVAAASALGRAHRTVQVIKRPASGIRDVEYQHECYTEGAVTERLSLFRRGTPAIIANAYRLRSRGAFEPSHAHAFSEMATFLYSTLERHAKFFDARSALTEPEALARRLTGVQGLSHREAQVIALIMTGMGQPEMAQGLSVAPATIITYRRRAYQKLSVNSRGELRPRLIDLLCRDLDN